MSEKFKLSPSAIKSYWQYEKREMCGLLFDELYVQKTGVQIPKTAKMLFGERFEFLTTGATLRDGTEPPPLLTPTGRVAKANEDIEIQRDRAHLALKENGITIKEVSVTLEIDRGDYILKNILDTVIEIDGVRGILDFKTSGLLGNKWEEFGWTKETLHYRRHHLIQAACNTITAREVWHQEHIPYFFYVAHNTNPDKAALFEVVFTDASLAEYDDMIENAYLGIITEQELDFQAHPDYERCLSCPLFDTCTSKRVAPKIDKVVVDVKKD